MSKSALKILVAYPYCTKQVVDTLVQFEKHHPGQLDLIIDSGAFTAFKTGKVITLSEYTKFLDSLPFKNFNYINLDVIGNPDKTEQNYQTMLRNGYHPVPVFTTGESFERIDELFEHTDYIAAGGLVGAKGTNKAIIYLNKLFKKLNGRKVHLLGNTTPDIIKYFKPYSCDSSTWEGGARFGAIPIYVGNGRIKNYKRDDFKNHPSTQLIQALKKIGIDYTKLQDDKNWRGGFGYPRICGAKSWLALQRDYDQKIGVKVFLACASKQSLELVLKAYTE